MSDPQPDNLLATLQWQSHNTQHKDITYIGQANFNGGALANHACSIREALETIETWKQDFAAGILTPVWNPELVKHLDRSHFMSHSPQIQLQPERGRFYPQKILSQSLEISGNDLQPFQIIEMDDVSITVDCNHPLAKYALSLSLEKRDDLIPSAKTRKSVIEAIERGAGLQAVNPDVPVEFFKPEAFRRIDENLDTAFYAQPRLVSHLDATARSEIAKIYSRFLQPGMKVLDLMSSWQSHLPDATFDLEITGLGMNAEELKVNPQLNDYCIHDLNSEPALPFDDDSYDLVVCTASIEYLTQPLAVMQEIRRVLKSQCTFITTFSERWFPPKVINIWSYLHPYEKLHFVSQFFHQTDGFKRVNTFSLRDLPRSKDDPYYQKMAFSDTVYAVWGELA